MSVYLGIEIDAVIVLMMSTILYKVKKNVDQQTMNILFGNTLWATLFMSLAEALSNWINSMGLTSQVGLALLSLSAILRYCLSSWMSYTWCMYLLFESEIIQKKVFNSTFQKVLAGLPALILCAVTVASPWTGWIFVLDRATGVFYRGKLFIIQIAVTYMYFIMGSTATLFCFIRSKNAKHKLTQMLFVFTPFIGGMIHLIKPELSVIWPLVAILLVIKFIGFQEDQIFIDGLTGLNNRRSFDKYLSSALEEHSGKNIVLYMIDVDHFKTINDTYGHVEGDYALIKTSDILRSVCAGKNAFLARYGGDEFAIVYHESKDENASAFCSRIVSGFDRYNSLNENSDKYSINISVGYANALRSGSELQLVSRADAALYENKKSHSLVSTMGSSNPVLETQLAL